MTNELNQIVQLLENVSIESKDAFIWWLIMDKGGGILVGLIIAASLLTAIRMIIVAMARDSRKHTFEVQVVDVLNIQRHSDGGLRPTDRNKIIAHLVQAHKAGTLFGAQQGQ